LQALQRRSKLCNVVANFATPLQKMSMPRRRLQRRGKLCYAAAKDVGASTKIATSLQLCNAVAKDVDAPTKIAIP